MNKRLLWTTAALLTATSGTLLSNNADSREAVNSKANRPAMLPETLPTAQPAEVVKVGEYQSSGTKSADTVIAKIQPHELTGRQAATLYVHNIPVIIFLSSDPVVTSSTKVGVAGDTKSVSMYAPTQSKVVTIGNLPNLNGQASIGTKDNVQSTDPVWRATAVAAKLNQLSLNNVDASTITVSWKNSPISSPNVRGSSQSNSQSYSIKVNGEELVEINAQTKLPDTTNDLVKDALQVTNRLRRLLGNAPPLYQVFGIPLPPKLPQVLPLPKLPRKISLGPVQISLNGWASWYGPGFHGNRSANGEVYNQYALTAAHRSLPFGTKVRVTNIRNGRSVVVRITDRGPFIRARILDLSAAAARILGVMQTGTAPVRVEVLRSQASVPAK